MVRNCSLFGSANTASRSERTNRLKLSFGFAELAKYGLIVRWRGFVIRAFRSVPASLPGCASQTGFSLVHFFWRGKRNEHINFGRAKMNRKFFWRVKEPKTRLSGGK